MTATPKPGTVANITISTDARNLEPMTYEGVFYSGWHNAWISQTMGQIHTGPDDVWTVTDVRPLVVLDLGDSVPDVVVNVLRKAAFNRLAEQIEAQTKPSRIPEPGLWGVVEAKHPVDGLRIHWMHGETNPEGNDWHSVDGNWHRLWSDLIDPALVRAGIEDGAR